MNKKSLGYKHWWSLVLKSLKHLFEPTNIIFFIANSPSLHYVPNQALSDQRQAIWIGRQCFLMRNKIIIHANKMNALKNGSQ
jgi:hypothetical protein